jgi:hypothetical protein
VSKHQTIQATDLRPGDRVRLGSSTNYVAAAETRDVVAVTVFNGDRPAAVPTPHLAPGMTVELAGRGLGPNEPA